MNLSRLVFEDEFRNTCVHDGYLQMLKYLSGERKLYIAAYKGYGIVPINLKFENTLLVTEQGVFKSDELTHVIIPVAGLADMKLNVVRWEINYTKSLKNYNASILLLDFQHHLLVLFLQLYEDALEQIFLHLNQRRVNGKNLTNKSAIQCEIASASLQVDSIKVILNTAVDHLLILSELSDLALKLIKLLGGRSMLSDNMVELKWALDIFRAFYFEECE